MSETNSFGRITTHTHLFANSCASSVQQEKGRSGTSEPQQPQQQFKEVRALTQKVDQLSQDMRRAVADRPAHLLLRDRAPRQARKARAKEEAQRDGQTDWTTTSFAVSRKGFFSKFKMTGGLFHNPRRAVPSQRLQLASTVVVVVILLSRRPLDGTRFHLSCLSLPTFNVLSPPAGVAQSVPPAVLKCRLITRRTSFLTCACASSKEPSKSPTSTV